MVGFNYCMNCGSKVDPLDKFCANCGAKLEDSEEEYIHDEDFFLKYDIKIENLKKEYDLKVNRAIELIQKQFNPSEHSYDIFISTINESNNVFYNNIEISLDIIKLASRPSERIKKELEIKIHTLERIIDKLEDFIDELIIHMSDESEKEVKTLTQELDDLINSVKDY